MVSPISLPVARLRASGCRVHHIIGHDPYTGGAHPNGRPNWHYGIVLPPAVAALSDSRLEDALWKYDHSWSSTVGDAVAYVSRNDDRILVYARTPEDPKATKPAHLRGLRKQTEREVATLLGRIADIIPSLPRRNV